MIDDETVSPIPADLRRAFERQYMAEEARIESLARDDLTERVSEAIRAVPFSAAGDADFVGMSEAAVQVFVDYLQNPPEIHTDMSGARRIRWNRGPRPHHPECGSLSVPDVLIVCQKCGGDCKWCGCMYRCPKCEAK